MSRCHGRGIIGPNGGSWRPPSPTFCRKRRRVITSSVVRIVERAREERVMRKLHTVSALVVSTCLLSACASSGPVVPVAPTVQVTEFNSTLITPDRIEFKGKVAIRNEMRASLEIQKVDWGADLHDRPLFDESFTQVKPLRSRGKQTVTFPFQIVMKDIIDQAVDVLAEESVRVRFRGIVHPVGFSPVPFEATRVIPCPKMPVVSLDGADGNPLDGAFTVHLKIRNTNSFPMALESMDSYVTVNEKKYRLLQSGTVAEMAPGATARVGLTMERTRGTALSMMVNVVRSKSQTFELGGSFTCRTPYGRVYVPLTIGSEGLTSVR